MIDKKVRIPLPDDIAASALFEADRTCCVCHASGRQLQIHHIDDDPSNNEPSNLAVLCLEHHAQTQLSGGFARKLNSALVIRYRNHWLSVVRMRREAEALGQELKNEHTASPEPRQETQLATPQGQQFQNKGVWAAVVDAYEAKTREQEGWAENGNDRVVSIVDADPGAKFVSVVVRIFNDTKRSLDIFGYSVDAYALDAKDRQFDPADRLSNVPGNPRKDLQPGFECDITWVYRVPVNVSIVKWGFRDATVNGYNQNSFTYIALEVRPSTPS